MKASKLIFLGFRMSSYRTRRYYFIFEVRDKYRQNPILQSKLNEVLHIRSVERCLQMESDF